MDRNKSNLYDISKRKPQAKEINVFDSLKLNSNQERISTAVPDVSYSSSIDFIPASDKTQEISRFYPNSKANSKKLQQIIAKSRPEELSIIIDTISPNISDLMMDLYGNYMCQTLFHNCSASQRLILLKAMKGRLLSVAYHPRGTHALQNLISMTSLKEEEMIYREEFKGRFVEMSKESNGSHVVQRL